jgi:hypothetical protein
MTDFKVLYQPVGSTPKVQFTTCSQVDLKSASVEPPPRLSTMLRSFEHGGGPSGGGSSSRQGQQGGLVTHSSEATTIATGSKPHKIRKVRCCVACRRSKGGEIPKKGHRCPLRK